MNLNATLIIEVASFLVLLGLLVKFLYRPLLNILDKRAREVREITQKIQENLKLAEKERAEARRLLAESKEQALRIKERVSLDAERSRQQIIDQAKEESKRLLQAFEQEIASETKKAKEKLKDEAINLSLIIAEKILHRKFTSGDQKRLIEELTEEIR